MTTYASDSLGAPTEIIDDELPNVVGQTFNGKDIYEDVEFLSHEAEVLVDGKLDWKDRYLNEKDIYDYVKTLRRNDLIEALEKLDTKELIDIFQMERTWL